MTQILNDLRVERVDEDGNIGLVNILAEKALIKQCPYCHHEEVHEFDLAKVTGLPLPKYLGYFCPKCNRTHFEV